MKKYILLFTVFILTTAVFLTIRQRAAAQDSQINQELRTLITQQNIAPLSPPPAQNPALVALGEALFYDKELSGNRDTSCATCHLPQFATGDALPLAIGTGGTGTGPDRVPGANRDFVARNTIDLFNRGLPAWETMFWDGRVAGSATAGFITPAETYLPNGLDNLLAAQAMFPVTIRDEMRGGWYNLAGYTIQPGSSPQNTDYQTPAGWHDVDVFGQVNELASISNDPQNWPQVWEGLMKRLLAIPAYQELFQQAYPTVPTDQLGFQHAANALAAYQTEAFAFINSPWQNYLVGQDKALSAEAKQGALLFYGAANCAVCHSGSLFTDQGYYNIGVPQFGPGKDQFVPLDYGRFHITNTPADQFAFRTPSLLNVTLTGPWLHNGAYDSLEDVIQHHLHPAESLQAYDGDQLPLQVRATLQNYPVTNENILQTLSPQLPQVQLSDREIAQLLAFLESLTDPAAADLTHLIPNQVPSNLPVGDS